MGHGRKHVLKNLHFEIDSALSELVGGPVFSGDSRRVTVTIPAQSGVDSTDPAGPTGTPGGVHTFVHQLTLDGLRLGVTQRLP